MKVLIVTYYWPPAGGPGVQRWLKFVKYLKTFGIEPIVYVPDNPTYAIEDDSLFADIPEGTTILKKPIFEPYRFAQFFSKKETKTISKGIIAGKEKQSFIQKLLLYIRGNFFIPDARKFWVEPSVKYLEKYIREHDIYTVITTGPPHSIHLIGLQLKNKLNIKWLADFRDPWTTIGYHDKLKLSRRAKNKHKKYEKEVLTHADQILVTSFSTQREFQALTTKPITVLTNGYDTEMISETILDTKFTISHIGSLLSGRNPKNLWRAIYELMHENQAFLTAVQLQLVGAVSDDVLQDINEAGLSDIMIEKGYVSHKDAVTIQRSTQLLLLIEIDSEDTKCIVPGKLFEYMVAKRPILALGPKGADISKLIKETNSGYFYEYHEYEQIKAQLLVCFKAFQQNKLVTQTVGIEKYSRKELTCELSHILKKM